MYNKKWAHKEGPGWRLGISWQCVAYNLCWEVWD